MIRVASDSVMEQVLRADSQQETVGTRTEFTSRLSCQGSSESEFHQPFAAPEECETPGGTLRYAESISDQEQRFHTLAEEWRTATSLSSSLDEICMHPAYQKIIGMGTVAVPLILRDLENEPDHWFWALAAITGEDPVMDEERGDLEAMTTAWLTWGAIRGLV